MARKVKKLSNVDPDFLKKQKASLVRKNRKVIYFNALELAAIEEYCRRYNITSKSAMMRKAIMEEVMAGLDEKHPTLF